MKLFFYLTGLILFFNCQVPVRTASDEQLEEVRVRCILSDCKPGDTLWLFSFEGIHFKKLQQATVKGDTFDFNLPSAPPRFYYVGTNEQNKKSLLVGQEPLVVLRGACNRLTQARTEGSPLNEQYASLTEATKLLKGEMSKAIRNYQQTIRSNPGEAAKVARQVASIDQRKLALLDSLRQTQPLMGKILDLESFTSFLTDQKGYDNEILHFANEYFRGIDLKDPFYNGVPQVFESFRNYGQTLASTNMPLSEMTAFIDTTLKRIPPAARTNRYALGGLVLGLQARNHPAFLIYGKRFVELYKDDNSPAINSLSKQIKSASRLAAGEVAPDFTQNTPEGSPLTLSSLKGKIVLIDFWASWCGPCRRENPNVVRLYNKYHEQGFEILGVSLDRKKDSWVKAIEKDGLPWYHVSDLRGWKNAVAQTYAVRSIPHTVLLDREGRIIARNLKGAQLEFRIEQLMNAE